MHLDDLISLRQPPPKRADKTHGEFEKQFTEPAVMLAYVFHLIRKYPSISGLEIHPDGMHGKQFDIRAWLEKHGFDLVEPKGSTKYGGRYNDGNRNLLVSPTSGFGDMIIVSDST